MNLVLGLDPGQTTGWCLYDTEHGTVHSSGAFPDHLVAIVGETARAKVVAIERPHIFRGSPPAMGDCCITFGRLVQKAVHAGMRVEELTRHEVRSLLQGAIHGEFPVRDDKTVWSALKILHGGDSCAKKGGALYGVKSHGRAALAVAVAWTLREQKDEGS